LQQLGVPLPHLAAWLTIGTETLGGLAVLLGFLVFWASIPMAVVLLVAMIRVHLPYGFSSVRLISISASGARFESIGYEIDLLYLAALLMFALQGPGPLASDHVLQGRTIRTASSEKERSSAPSETDRTVHKIGEIVGKDDSAPRRQ
jgi:putative oxidoreductase